MITDLVGKKNLERFLLCRLIIDIQASVVCPSYNISTTRICSFVAETLRSGNVVRHSTQFVLKGGEVVMWCVTVHSLF